MLVGTIAEIWRYPVKSMAGEQCSSAQLDEFGMIGDRYWAALHRDTGDIAWAKGLPALLNLSARYQQDPLSERVYASDVPDIVVTFPNGDVVNGAGNVEERLSDYLGKPIVLRPVEPPQNIDFFKRARPLNDTAIRKMLGIKSGEAVPDLSIYDRDHMALMMEHFAPPGTFLDLFPLHFITRSSLQYMEQETGIAFDVRRFRPSFVIDTVAELSGPVEFDWVGKSLQIGSVKVMVNGKTVRCSMPSRGQESYGLSPEPNIGKSIATMTERFLGGYGLIEQAGSISVGDEVHLLDNP